MKLLSDFEIADVYVGTKAANHDNPEINYSSVTGPINCNAPIPEFSTLAIPLALSILIGLFFLNNSKKGKA